LLAMRFFSMVESEKFVAVALLTRSELQGIGQALRFVVPLDEAPDDFAELLARIDDAPTPNK
jgi:hypothetical protein